MTSLLDHDTLVSPARERKQIMEDLIVATVWTLKFMLFCVCAFGLACFITSR